MCAIFVIHAYKTIFLLVKLLVFVPTQCYDSVTQAMTASLFFRHAVNKKNTVTVVLS